MLNVYIFDQEMFGSPQGHLTPSRVRQKYLERVKIAESFVWYARNKTLMPDKQIRWAFGKNWGIILQLPHRGDSNEYPEQLF